MKTTLNIAKGFNVTITIETSVMIVIDYYGDKRSYWYNGIESAARETTIPAISQYLMSI
jgi:hypothetical protein